MGRLLCFIHVIVSLSFLFWHHNVSFWWITTRCVKSLAICIGFCVKFRVLLLRVAILVLGVLRAYTKFVLVRHTLINVEVLCFVVLLLFSVDFDSLGVNLFKLLVFDFLGLEEKSELFDLFFILLHLQVFELELAAKTHFFNVGLDLSLLNQVDIRAQLLEFLFEKESFFFQAADPKLVKCLL